MNDEQITRLSRMFGAVAEMNAAVTRRAGMELANLVAMSDGKPPIYGEQAFIIIQQQIEYISNFLQTGI